MLSKDTASFFLIYSLTYPLRFLPYRSIHALGKFLGSLLFYVSPKFRKRSLSNVALASSLALSPQEIRKVAKGSLQNLFITCLEYAKLDREKTVSNIATCVNPETALQLMNEGKPPIFFCGHQANWEILFFEGTSRMKGVAIGRPIENKALYQFVLRIREKWRGKILTPKEAVKGGLKGLKQGAFLGIVGDQGMPDSGYSSPFFGRKAWTSPLPALLSYRTGSPLIVATTKREKGHYSIHYSDPIWPNKERAAEEEIDRLMKSALSLLEASIAETPDQWLFSHNRWKQQLPGRVKRKFRHESILIILPCEEERTNICLENKEIEDVLHLIKKIYPQEFITLYTPVELLPLSPFEETIVYAKEDELYREDYRFKFVINLTSSKKIEKHFRKLSALTTLSLDSLRKKHRPLAMVLQSELLVSDAS